MHVSVFLLLLLLLPRKNSVSKTSEHAGLAAGRPVGHCYTTCTIVSSKAKSERPHRPTGLTVCSLMGRDDGPPWTYMAPHGARTHTGRFESCFVTR